jgi:hypothetical protein
MAPTLLGIDHIHVFVQDREAAEAWYARVMGLSRSPGLEFWAADGGPLTIQDPATRFISRCSSGRVRQIEQLLPCEPARKVSALGKRTCRPSLSSR